MKKSFILVIFTLSLFSLFSMNADAQTGGVDILWQGRGYSRPFYPGRTLWSKQSEITFVAIPQNLGNPSGLNYRWIRNGTVLGTVSGVGRNSLSFLDTVFSKPVEISVEIVSDDDSILAEASTLVAPTSPFIMVYENNPLYGLMFHREVADGYEMENEEVTFAAFPFFFSAESRINTSLVYNWNGEVEKSLITYRTPEGGGGITPINIGVTDKDWILQTAEKNFVVQFGNNE